MSDPLLDLLEHPPVPEMSVDAVAILAAGRQRVRRRVLRRAALAATAVAAAVAVAIALGTVLGDRDTPRPGGGSTSAASTAGDGAVVLELADGARMRIVRTGDWLEFAAADDSGTWTSLITMALGARTGDFAERTVGTGHYVFGYLPTSTATDITAHPTAPEASDDAIGSPIPGTDLWAFAIGRDASIGEVTGLTWTGPDGLPNRLGSGMPLEPVAGPGVLQNGDWFRFAMSDGRPARLGQ